MVDVSLNSKTDLEGSFSKDIVKSGEKEGGRSQADFWRGRDQEGTILRAAAWQRRQSKI